MIAALLACLLALVAGTAAALGLGQIRVKSQPGEPLLAEIPIVASDPSELRNLQVGLASPETFRRIGLQPPQGAVAELRFAVALDAQGNPVVRVTTLAPVQQPLLTFLVEADWGRGKLVREYSALINAPDAVAAPVQPPIQAPRPAPDNSIVRSPASQPPVVVQSLPQETPEPPEPEPVTAPEPEATPPPVAVQPVPSPAAPAAPRPAASQYVVQRGDALSEIASALDFAGNFSRNQVMLALLRANPDAFIDNNINLVKAGAVLQIPGNEELGRLDSAEAAAMVRAQVRSWRESRRAPPQPALADAASVASSNGDDIADGSADAAGSGARLEIVPPSGGDSPGTRSGISAGGEGEMLQTQVLQEELASREAEAEELRARVAELEQLQQKQQQLIALKDSELAAVEQRLAQGRTGEGETAGTATTQQDGNDAQSGLTPWLLGGLGLLGLAALAWWLWRRRRKPRVAPAFTRRYGTASLASGMVPARSPGDAQPAADMLEAGKPAGSDASSGSAGASARATAETENQLAATTSAADASSRGSAAPASHAVEADTDEPAAETTTKAVPAAKPTWHAEDKVPADTAMAAKKPPAGDSIALARAYIDLGDEDAARSLLQDILQDDDPAMRDEASRLMRSLED